LPWPASSACGRSPRAAIWASVAAKHLTEAREGFRSMQMTFWLERLGDDLAGPAVTGPPEI
jgi:hypothetical protein